MRRWPTLAAALWLALSGNGAAEGARHRAAPQVRTSVVALAADRVYLPIGRARGLSMGAEVIVRPRRGGAVRARIDALSEHGASFALAEAPSRVAAGDGAEVQAAGHGATAAPHAQVGPVGDPASLHARALALPAAAPPLVVAAVDRNRPQETRASRTEAPWSGMLALSAFAMRDLAPGRSLAFYQFRLDSRLSGRGLAGGRVDYDHRLAVLGEFGSAVDRVPGQRRPILRADWLYATYRPDPAGAFRASGGRLLPSAPLVGPLDGGRAGLEGKHGGVALSAGAAAAPDNLDPSAKTVRAGLEAFGRGRLGGFDVRADAAAAAAVTEGNADRSAFSLGLLASRSGLGELAAYAEAGLLPADLRGTRGAIGLDRAHATLFLHPAASVDVLARYALDRPLVDRALRQALPAEYLRDERRQVAGGSVRVRAGRFSVEPFGDVDLSDTTGVRWRAGGRATLDRFPDEGTRLSLHGARNDGAALGGATGGARLAHQFAAPVDAWVGYDVSVIDQRAIAEAYVLSSVSGGAQWMVAERLSIALEGSYDTGGFEEAASGFFQLAAWF
jgi:hypothetical protein